MLGLEAIPSERKHSFREANETCNVQETLKIARPRSPSAGSHQQGAAAEEEETLGKAASKLGTKPRDAAVGSCHSQWSVLFGDAAVLKSPVLLSPINWLVH